MVRPGHHQHQCYLAELVEDRIDGAAGEFGYGLLNMGPFLLVWALVYLRLTSGAHARDSLNVLMTPSRPFMQRPTFSALWREASGTVGQFLFQAMPVFVAICLVASLLAHFGVLDLASRVLGPSAVKLAGGRRLNSSHDKRDSRLCCLDPRLGWGLAAVIFADEPRKHESETSSRRWGTNRLVNHPGAVDRDAAVYQCTETQPIEYAVGLLSQQAWCWGRDILRPEGN